VQTGYSVASPAGVGGPSGDIEDTIGREFPRQQPDDIFENPEISRSECGRLPPDIHDSWLDWTVSFRRTDFSSHGIVFSNDRDRPSRKSRLWRLIDKKATGNDFRPARSWLLTGDQIHHEATDESFGYGGTRTERTAGQLAVIPVGSVDGYSRCLGNRSGFAFRGPFGKVVGSLVCGSGGDDVVLFYSLGNHRFEVERTAMSSETVKLGILAHPSPDSLRVAA
jgi:hypothetical protein